MNPISSRQVTGVLLVVLSGWSLTMTAQDGRDGWIVLLLAGLCSLPVAALCCLASERMPQGDWFQLPRAAFGAVGGALYMWTLAALAFWSLCMTVLSGVIFLRTVSGGIWPVWLLTAALLVCAALILSFFAGCVRAGSTCQKSRGVWLGAILAGLPCILCAGSNQAFGMAQELYQILFLPVVVFAAGALFAKVHTKSSL